MTGGRKGRDSEGEGGGGLRVARGCGEAAATAERSGLGEGEKSGGRWVGGTRVGNRSGFGRDGLPLSGGARTREREREREG